VERRIERGEQGVPKGREDIRARWVVKASGLKGQLSQLNGAR